MRIKIKKKYMPIIGKITFLKFAFESCFLLVVVVEKKHTKRRRTPTFRGWIGFTVHKHSNDNKIYNYKSLKKDTTGTQEVISD